VLTIALADVADPFRLSTLAWSIARSRAPPASAVTADIADNQDRRARLMGHALGHRPKRLEAVQAATADDKEVGVGSGSHERPNRLVGHVLVAMIDYHCD
jgi:hypothetical protein